MASRNLWGVLVSAGAGGEQLNRAAVLSDGLVGLAYIGIFVCLLWLGIRLRKVWNFPGYLWILTSFALFVVACLTSRLLDMMTFWAPASRVSSLIEVLCAAASIPAAIMLAHMTPTLALKIPHVMNLLSTSQQERDDARLALLASEKILEERRRYEIEIAAANDRMNQILDSTSEAILKLGGDWTILYGNRVAHEIAPDLIVGKSYWECFPAIRGSDSEAHLRAAMEQRIDVEWENFYEPYQEHYAVHAYPTIDGLSLFFIPVTQRKRLEDQLERERTLREKRIEALSHMAGGLAHEISNPLAIIHGTASLLQRLAAADEALDVSEVLRATATIINTSDRASRILRGLRGFAHDAGKDPMEPASIYDIVEQVVQMQEARFERHGVGLMREMPMGIPPLLCRETQVGQILTNLVNNAYDAITQQDCPEKWVSVEISIDEKHLCVDVVDSGLGIDAEARKRLMEPFFTTKTRGLGMGVGLSLSRAMASEHGGSLELREETTHTTFRLLLPMDAAIEQVHAQEAGVIHAAQ